MQEIGAPIESLIEYISAPAYAPKGGMVDTRETLINKAVEAAGSNWSSGEVINRVSYGGAFLTTITAATLLLSRIGGANEETSYYVGDLNAFFDGAGDAIPVALDAMGLDGASMLSGMEKFGKVLLLGISLGASTVQRQHLLKKHANIAQNLFNPSSAGADELFSEPQKDKIDRNYRLLNESDKHLIAHLTPFEQRVVLSGGKDAAKEMFAAKPIPFANHMMSVAHGCSSQLEFIAQTMSLCLPESLKKPVRDFIVNRGGDTKEVGAADNLIKKIYERRQAAEENQDVVAASTIAPTVRPT